jgi:hypothetical protein
MLDSLFVTPTVTAVVEALKSAHAEGSELAVVGHARRAASLAKKMSIARRDLSTVEDRSLAGVIVVDANDDVARVVRDGGVIVFVDKGDAVEASRRALCAGLVEIEQRTAGRTIVTSGRVAHL